jgi:hypothetical protein
MYSEAPNLVLATIIPPTFYFILDFVN